MKSLVLALVLVTLCVGGTMKWNFEDGVVGAMGAGWQPGWLDEGSGCKEIQAFDEWTIIKSTNGKALARTTINCKSNSDKYYSSCINYTVSVKNFELTAKVKLYPEEFSYACAGILFRAKNPKNYYVAQFKAQEHTFALYKVVDGVRTLLISDDLPGVQNHQWITKWITMKIIADGSRITAYVNGQPVRFDDPTFDAAGSFGLWSQGRNKVIFDDIVLSSDEIKSAPVKKQKK